jgi:hypothetical protein
MRPSRTASRKPQASISGPQSPTTRAARPRAPIKDEVGIDTLSELAEQISERCRERERHLDEREAELDEKEGDLAVRLENLRMREYDLRRRERQLTTLASDIEERQQGLDYTQHRLTLMKDNLLQREDLVKNAIEDLRDRESALEEKIMSAQNNVQGCPYEFNMLPATFSVNTGASTTVPPPRPLPLITPNRRHLSVASSVSSYPTNVDEVSEVQVTHKRRLPAPPALSHLDHTTPRRSLPLAPSPECRNLSDRDSSGNDWDGLSDVSSDDEPDDFFEDGQTLSDRPPTYHTYHGPEATAPFNRGLAEKLRAALLSTLKMAPADIPSPEETTGSVSTPLPGIILREHVDDIAAIDDQAERDRG